MRPIAADVTWSVSMSVAHSGESYKKDEPIEVAFGMWTPMGAMNHSEMWPGSPHKKDTVAVYLG